MANVMVATPTTGLVRSAYVGTVLETLKDLARSGIPSSYENSDGPDIPFQRNTFATRFLKDLGQTHLFFVDSDMSFDGAICRRLLAADKPLIGCIYMRRDETGRWNIRHLAQTGTVETGGLMRCAGLGCGAMLIRRDVLETMIKRGAATQVIHAEPFFNFFDARPQDIASRIYVGEDMSFCRRWTEDCDGEVWSLADAKIGHISDYAYGADQSYLDHMKRTGAFKPATTKA